VSAFFRSEGPLHDRLIVTRKVDECIGKPVAVMQGSTSRPDVPACGFDIRFNVETGTLGLP